MRNQPSLLTEAYVRKKLMKSMKSVSSPLWNISHVGILLIAILALFVGCKGGGGGGRIERICEDYCERAITECLDIPRAENECVDECIDDVDEAEELDGSDCADAQLAAFECVTEQACVDVFTFADLEAADLPLAFCTAEVNDAVALCVESIEL